MPFSNEFDILQECLRINSVKFKKSFKQFFNMWKNLIKANVKFKKKKHILKLILMPPNFIKEEQEEVWTRIPGKLGQKFQAFNFSLVIFNIYKKNHFAPTL